MNVRRNFQVYYDNSEKPVFFVANRGHHADIGGLVPGSMPPHSTKLEQEGACITSFKIVENGKFQEEGSINILSTIVFTDTLHALCFGFD